MFDRHLSQASEREAVALRAARSAFGCCSRASTDHAIFMLDTGGPDRQLERGRCRASRAIRPTRLSAAIYPVFHTPEDLAPRRAGDARYETAARRGSSRPKAGGCARTAAASGPDVRDRRDPQRTRRHLGFAKVTRDITERKQAQEALDQAREALSGPEDGGRRPAHRRRRARLQQPAHGRSRQPRTAEEAAAADDPKLQRLLDNAMQGAQRGAS